MNIRQKISLEVFEQYEEVTYYTIRYDQEEYSETEKFFLNFMDKKEFKEDIDIISRKIENIGRKGCEERHFRHAGKMRDDVCSLPEYCIGSKLRLYAIKVSKNVVILGNGGYKNTKTYNEDPVLNNYVTTLQIIDGKLKRKIYHKKININNNILQGSLTFEI
ncbi:hypothetical protein D3C87_592670 [compost metagenome]